MVMTDQRADDWLFTGILLLAAVIVVLLMALIVPISGDQVEKPKKILDRLIESPDRAHRNFGRPAAPVEASADAATAPAPAAQGLQRYR